jgi:endonuclease YncB( thermonuclease family)
MVSAAGMRGIGIVWAATALLLLGLSAQASDVKGTARVIDGDTLEIGGTRIRLLGIDSPERGEAVASAATDRLRRITAGHILICTDTGGRTHKRIVAKCTIENGTDIAREMVSEGLAAACPRFTPEYLELEKAARESGRGIWADGLQYQRKPYCVSRR